MFLINELYARWVYFSFYSMFYWFLFEVASFKLVSETSTLIALSNSLLPGFLISFESYLSELRFCIDSYLVTVVLDLFFFEIIVFIFLNGDKVVALSYLSIFEGLSSWLLVSVTFFLEAYLIVLPLYSLVIFSFLILSAPTLAETVTLEFSVLLSC